MAQSFLPFWYVPHPYIIFPSHPSHRQPIAVALLVVFVLIVATQSCLASRMPAVAVAMQLSFDVAACLQAPMTACPATTKPHLQLLMGDDDDDVM